MGEQRREETQAAWRVGRKLGRTLYRHDALVGLIDDEETAAEIVAGMNAVDRSRGVLVAEPVRQPVDGKPGLRRHSIPGWWQVWSGHGCIALLRPEDVPDVLRGAP